MAASKRRQDEKHLKILRELGALPHNKQCFDCHQRGPTYLNMTIGSFVCTSCSGILRGLNPPHRVKSISMASFTPDEIEFIRSRGNEYCRREWMGTYDGQPPIESETKDEQRIKDFMMTKYERKRWYTDPSSFRHQPLVTSPPASSTQPSIVNNNKPPSVITNNITINRPVMQSASFPPLTSTGRPSMDLLGATTNNANASFANFDNFVSASTTDFSNVTVESSLSSSPLELAFADDNIPIVGKSFLSRIASQKRALGLSLFSSINIKSASRFPIIDSSKNHFKLKPAIVESTNENKDHPVTSSFIGSSTQSSVGTHPAPTNIIADSAFGGIAASSSTPSSSVAVTSRSGSIASPPASLQPPVQTQAKDRYAALADLDSLFNSSVPNSTSVGVNSTVDWDVAKSNTSNSWNSAFTSGSHQLPHSSPSIKDIDNVQTPSNPFTGINFNSSVWNQKSNVPTPSPGNPFASSILNQTNNVGSSPEMFNSFPISNAPTNNYNMGSANMPWGNSSMAVPTPFLTAATNGNYPPFKAQVQPQFGLWQPSIGNPFAAAVVSAPQKTNSSNPFL